MYFNFSILKAIKEVWPIYKVNFGLLTLLSAVTLILNAVFQDAKFFGFILTLATTGLITFIWIIYSIGLLKDEYYDFFSRKTFPTLSQYWDISKTIIFSFLLLATSALFLVFPAFYIGGRIIFAPFLCVIKKQSATKSISESWLMTRNNGWKLFWKGLIIMSFILAGSLVFGVGILLTLPLGYLVIAKMYQDYASQYKKYMKDLLNEQKNEENLEEVEKL